MRLILVVLALALGGCDSETNGQHAFRTCKSLNGLAFTQCYGRTMDQLEAQDRQNEEAATLILMGATAFIDGYNEARDAERVPAPVFTSCNRTGAVVNCISQ